MSAFQLGLPDVMVGVDEARGNDLAFAVDDLDSGISHIVREGKVFADVGDDAATHQHIGVVERNNMLVLGEGEDSASSEK